MKWLLFIPLLLILSCGEEEVKVSEDVDSTPPSLQEESSIPEILKISDKQIKELHLQFHKAEKKITKIQIAAPGNAYPDPTAYSIVSSPISGRISRIYAHEGEYVDKGQVIVELQSLEFASILSEFVKSKAETEYYNNQLERLNKLHEQKITSQAELDRVKSEYQRAFATSKGIESKLLSIGLSKSQINSYGNSENISDPVLQIKAPISGIIDKHEVELGQSVEMYQNLMDIIDNNKVLIKGFLSPEDASIVETGDTVITLSQKNNPDKKIYAIIKSINPALDEEHKSVVINAYAKTYNGFPRPGENLRLSINTYSKIEVVTVPLSAVTYFGEKPVVFIKKDKNTYELREINICRSTDEIAVLCEGVETGEEIVINQIFSLKALSKFSEYAE